MGPDPLAKYKDLVAAAMDELAAVMDSIESAVAAFRAAHPEEPTPLLKTLLQVCTLAHVRVGC
jgi:hypothetical protein